MAIQKFDELNNRERYEEYYSVMDISREQMLERIELAELLDDVFLFVFTYLNAQILASVSVELSKDSLSELCERRYTEALEKYGIDMAKHPDVKEYVSRVSKDMVESTIDKGIAKNDKTKKKESQTSDRRSDKTNDIPVENTVSNDIQQRALSVAEQEANTIFNRIEYDDAIDSGRYTKKTWITEQDDRVRPTHLDVDFVTVLINEAFEVGDSLMMFPKDDSLGASLNEICNCRCSIIYS